MELIDTTTNKNIGQKVATAIVDREAERKKKREALRTKRRMRTLKKREGADLKKLKIAQAKALKYIGLDNQKIADMFGTTRGTVRTWLGLPDKEFAEATEIIKKQLLATDIGLNVKAVEAIDEHLNNSDKMAKTKLNELTGLYRTTREFLTPTNKESTQQTNIQINLSKDNFSIEEI